MVLDDEVDLETAAAAHATAGHPCDIITHEVRELLRRRPIAVEPNTSLDTVLATLAREHIGCVLVTKDERLVGILTERDVLLKVTVAGRDRAGLTAADLMTPDPETLHPDQRVAAALNRMSTGGFRHVPVVDDAGRPVGVVSLKDIARLIVDHYPHEILTEPPAGTPPFRSPDGA